MSPTTFVCHRCYISEYIYLYILHVNFPLRKHFSLGHRISYPAHTLEWTNNKPFSGLIAPRYMATSRTVAHQTGLRIYSRSIKTVTTMIHYCYSLMTSTTKWRPIIMYRKTNVTSWNCIPGLEYLLKSFIFERDSYFWKKRTLMLTFNFDVQN